MTVQRGDDFCHDGKRNTLAAATPPQSAIDWNLADGSGRTAVEVNCDDESGNGHGAFANRNSASLKRIENLLPVAGC